MEMGTGKTKVALDLINYKINKIDYVLWICPYSIKGEIEQEKNKWYPDLKIDIVGCETIGSSDRTYINLFNRVRKEKTFIVVDESLKIKNKEAKRTKRILELGKYAEYKLILNGTPLSKNVLDLYTQMNFLNPKILNMSYKQFKNNYCEYYLRGRLKNLVKKQHNIEHLINLIKPYIFDSKLDISSKKNYENLEYDLEDYKEYQNSKMEILSQYKNNLEFNFFGITTCLQQIYTKSNRKLLNETINKINDKVIVFVKYLDGIP